jgi:uncharacterized protein with HEPN domain
MLRDRNRTSHTYDEGTAEKIYENIKGYIPEMKKTYMFLTKHFECSDYRVESIN